GDDVDSEPLRHRDHRPDEMLGAALSRNGLDKGTIELDGIDLQAMEVAEGGEAGAEVINRNRDAERAQQLHLSMLCTVRIDHHTLGDLQFETAWRNRPGSKQRLDALGKAGPRDLDCGDVDGHHDGRTFAAAPFRDLPAHFGNDPLADGDDQTGRFGDMDELGGLDLAQFGMIEADERLDTGQFPGGGELRLIEEPEPALLQRIAEILLDADAIENARI